MHKKSWRSHAPLKKSDRRVTNCHWSAALMLCGPLAVTAQTNSALDAVVVTGTHLAGSAGDTALPVQVITRREIDRSGARTAADLLAQVSANVPYRVEAVSVGAYGPAAFAGANLRGLGEASTLVLVNGRRLATHSGMGSAGNATDLNAITLAAVERVEVLKDGASAIYGSDAIGGVINFILRQDFHGVDVQLDGSQTSQGGAGQRGIAFTAGGALGETQTHWLGTLAWQRDQALHAQQRSYARSAYVPGLMNQLVTGTSPAGVWTSDGRLLNPASPNCPSPGATPDPQGSGTCYYDYAQSVDLLPQTERLNAHTQLDGALPGGWRWHAEAMGSQITQYARSSPGYLGGTLLDTSPYYPSSWAAANGLSGRLDLDWRLVDQGPRIDRHVGQQARELFSVQGQAGDWQLDSALTFTQHRLVSSLSSGYYRQADVQGLLDAGVLNPFGPQTPAAQAQLDALSLSDRYAWLGTRSQAVDLKGSRALGSLPGGAATLALGGEWRRETMNMAYSADARDCTVVGILCGGYDLVQARHVGSLFSELRLPFDRAWTGQVALRHDRYTQGGSATTPKAALQWRAAPELLWRASAGRGFIAPSLQQLHAPQTTTAAAGGPFNDSVRSDCATPSSAPYDCGVQYSAQEGGNRQLAPETSKQFGLGLVLGGRSRWRANVDAWAIRKDHRIGYVPASTIFADLAQYESLGYVKRYDPSSLPAGASCTPGPNGVVCPIESVDTQLRNLGRQRAAGVDLGAQWRSTPMPWGTVGLALDGTWVQQFESQVSSVSPYTSQLGRYALDFAVPRWRHQIQVNLSTGMWSWTLAQRYVASYVDYNPDPTQFADRRVSAQSLWDAQAAYRVNDQAAFTVGVRNLFNTAPPASRQQNSFQAGYDPRLADPRGRTVYVRTNVRF